MTFKRWARVLCLVLCLTVLAPCVSALGETKTNSNTTKVACYLLRLRKGPSTDAEVLDAFPRGTTVTILKKGDTWTKVKVRGKTGYMMTSMLAYGRNKVSAQATSPKVTKATASTKSTTLSSGSTAYIVKGVRVNLREEANSTSYILGSFRGGTKVIVLKKGRHWTKVEVQGLEGYIYNDYLTTEKQK